MAAKKKVVLLLNLAAIVLAGEAGGKAHEDVFAPLANAGLIEVANYDEATKVADVRATAAGIAQYQASLPPVFEIEQGVAIPAVVGRGRSSSAADKYPFEKLEIGQSFFVPDSIFDKDGEPGDAAKTMSSTVATANRRYAEEIPGETKTVKVKGEEKQVPATRQLRKFVTRAVDESEKGRGKGARVWRVEV